MGRKHLLIIITMVVAFGSFMLGYSLPPFLEVGFGGGDKVGTSDAGGDNADLMKYYQGLDSQEEE